MNRRYFSTVFSLILFLFVASSSFAQGYVALDEAPHDIAYYRESKIAPPLVKVLYGRPKKQEDVVFGKEVPYGKIWRTGANEATEVKFYKDVQFGEIKVPAGTYVLLTIPYKDEWEIILNSQLDVWGAFQYNPNYDIARMTVPVSRGEELAVFSIDFSEKRDKIQMVLGWGQTRVYVPLQFEKQGTVVSNH
ncbi:DUF2911 domain-containing protein [Flavobacteriaceae bacterium F08102]|nr:DUF2911 domain-containing protein [Flavobacteriaceae bacterium F08102]